MQAVCVLESDLAAISSDRASEGGEGPVVDSLPDEHEALFDVGKCDGGVDVSVGRSGVAEGGGGGARGRGVAGLMGLANHKPH